MPFDSVKVEVGFVVRLLQFTSAMSNPVDSINTQETRSAKVEGKNPGAAATLSTY